MLYIVGMPIGNIEDTSLRGAKTLAEADIILTEDTRSFIPYFKSICTLFNIESTKNPKVVPFHDQSEFKDLPKVLTWLAEGKNVVLVSEAGMPVISDPGGILVEKARKAEYPIDIVPGPTAFTSALALVGYQGNSAIFVGFLPKSTQKVTKLIRSYNHLKDSILVAYESPRRLPGVLEIVSHELPDLDITIVREITKEHQEVISGKPSELLQREYLGEIVLIIKL